MPIPGFFVGTEMPTAGWWEALWPDPAAVLTAVGLKPGLDVVDLCCGDGWFTREIAETAAHVTAIDLDPALLAVARNRVAAHAISRCDFVAADAHEIATSVRGTEFVFLANAFHGVPDRSRLAGAVAAALKPGGLLAIVNWHPRPREETTVLGAPRGPATALRISLQDTRAAVESARLRFLRAVEIAPYHYAAVFARTDAAQAP